MKIAAITITYNDDYKLEEWYQHYLTHKDDLFLHIIVDNNSEKKYLSKVEDKFTDSIIIKRESNGGFTKAYNDGIRYALNNPEVDAIMILGNDFKFTDISKLYEFLFSNSKYGMVAPIVLSKGSNTLIEDYGCAINSKLYLTVLDQGEELTSELPLFKIVDTVAGGLNLSRKEFYEDIGLQDENLFMYSDEVDTGLRAKKSKFKIATTRQAITWHEHINPEKSTVRLGYAHFLMRRNKIYLGYKHFGFVKALNIFMHQLIIFPIALVGYIKGKKIKLGLYYLLGSLFGLLKLMKNYNFIINNKI